MYREAMIINCLLRRLVCYTLNPTPSTLWSMIPSFQYTHFFIGPIQIQVWGLFVALGVLLAVWLATEAAKKRGLDYKKFSDILFWIIVWSFVGARLGHVVLYEWAYYSQHLADVVSFSEAGVFPCAPSIQ